MHELVGSGTRRGAVGVALALALLVGGGCGPQGKTTRSCEDDAECIGGVCFEEACYTTCQEQDDCAPDEFCVVVARAPGDQAAICLSASAHAGCTRDGDCADLVAGTCEVAACGLDAGVCGVAPAPDGHPCRIAGGDAGTCRAAGCEPVAADAVEVDAVEVADAVADPGGPEGTGEPAPEAAEAEAPPVEVVEPPPDGDEPTPEVVEPTSDAVETADVPPADGGEGLGPDVPPCGGDFLPCDVHADCCSGACVPGPDGQSVCTVACSATCPEGWVCDAADVDGESLQLCVPGLCVAACDGRACGPDGCSGACGSCGAGDACTSAGQCHVDHDLDGLADPEDDDDDGDGATDGDDCASLDPAVHPGAADPCDGRDADCDGLTDEDHVPQSTACGVGACARTGERACVAGSLIDTCSPGAPAADDATCDAVDDDCNGLADDGFAPTIVTCAVGACQAQGTTVCEGGAIGDSCSPGGPGADDRACNAIDDDCDGQTDEDYEAPPTTCGVGACAAGGELACQAGAVVDTCIAGTPAAGDATCDAVDDDCDGTADEDPGACPAGQVCQAGACVVDCDDGVPCTIDTFDALVEACEHQADDAFCDDGDPCTGLESCDAAVGCRVTRPVLDGTCAVPCGLDTFEVNDAFSTAAALPAGTYPWLTACVGDVDLFELTVGDNELIEVAVLFEDAIGNVNAWLYDSEHRMVAASASWDDDEALAFTASAAGSYFLRVALDPVGDDVDPGNYYALDVRLGAPCVDAFENNDTRETSAPIASGVYPGLTACPGEEDHYALSLGANELIEVGAAFEDALGDVDLRLYDPAGALVATSVTNSDHEALVHTTAAAGVYDLAVALDPYDLDDDGPGNTYELSLALGEPCTDAHEDNDVAGAAATLAPGTHAGLRACPADADWYAFDAKPNELIEVDAHFFAALGDVDLELLDPTGVRVALAAANGDDERLVTTAALAGTYRLGVTFDAASDDAEPGNTYELVLTAGAPCTDVFEDDDSLAQAVPLGGGVFEGLRACPDDADHLAIPVLAGETLTVDAAFDGADGNLDLAILNPAGASVAWSPHGVDAEHVAYTAPLSGTYVVRVVLNEATSDATPGADYALTISGVAPCVPTTSCEAAGAECGGLHDGCGVVLACGTCPEGQLCGDDLRCNCTPTTCQALGADCGQPPNGCGGQLPCGSCTLPAICGGAYVDHVCAVPTCTPDTYEDDDLQATATLVGTGLYEGLTSCLGDHDFFGLEVSDNETIEVRAAFVHALGDVELHLFEPGGGLVAASTGNSDEEHLVYTTLRPGTYALRVSLDPYAADDVVPGSRYALEVSLGQPCTDAHENNDTLAAAAPLEVGAHAGLNACPNDDDFYSFAAGANEIIELDVAFSHALGDIDLRLYDPAGAYVASSSGNGDGEHLVYTTLSAGTYKALVALDVYAADDATPGNLYELTLFPGVPCTDVFEDNDLSGRATLLGSGTFPGLRACPNDDDFYALPVAVGEIITVDVAFAHAAGDVDLRLYDPSGALVASSASNSDDEQVTHLAATAGTYTVLVALDVYAADDATPGNDYALTIAGTAACVPSTSCVEAGAECGWLHDGCGVVLDCGTCADGGLCSDNLLCNCVPTTCLAQGADCGQMSDGCGTMLTCGACALPEICGGAYLDNVCAEPTCLADAYEDDDTQATATPVPAGVLEGLVSCSGDPDFVSFPVGNNEIVDVRALFSHAKGDVDLYLFDPAGRLVAGSSSNDDDERVVTTTLQAGTYAVRANLDPYAGDDTLPGNRYALDVAYGAPCTDAHEDNETLETAAPLAAGAHLGLRSCPDDPDWYELELSNNELLLVDVLFTHAQGDLDVRLYNARGVLVDSSTSNSDDEAITFTTSEAGRHYVYVAMDPYAGDDAEPGNAYDLVLGQGTLCTDAHEDNDTRETALPLPAGLYPELTACPEDVDWYELTVGANELIEVALSFTDAKGDVDVRLYDAAQTLLATSTSNTDHEQIVTTAPQAGLYYLQVGLDVYDVSGFRGGSTYQLDLALGAPCTDAYEDNDALAAAAPIATGTHADLQACPDDADYYVLTLAAGQTLQLDVLFVHAAGDLDARLYDPSGKQVASSVSNNDDEAITYTATAPGPYTFLVGFDPYGADDATPGNIYELDLAVTP